MLTKGSKLKTQSKQFKEKRENKEQSDCERKKNISSMVIIIVVRVRILSIQYSLLNIHTIISIRER